MDRHGTFEEAPDGRSPSDPDDQVLRVGNDQVLRVGDAEVKDLASFIDGAAQVPDVRARLRRSWGFCGRHTWLLAVVECELRRRPFGTSVLYEDLTARAAAALSRARARAWPRSLVLRAGNDCSTCDFVSMTAAHGLPPDPARAARVDRVARQRRFSSLVLAARAGWEERSCPRCLGGNGPVCRPHLLAGERVDIEAVGNRLADVADRLGAFVRSMAWQGPVADEATASSWIEALGWFAGWSVPAGSALQRRAGGRTDKPPSSR